MSKSIYRHCVVAITAVCLLGLVGCGGEDAPYRKPTSKVHGVITVDGAAPMEAIQIQCHLQSAADPNHTTVSAAQSGEGGKFEIATYESGDGVPAGDYALTFEWKQLNLISMSYSGPDKLNMRYNDVSKSEVKFTVKEDSEPIDLGTIALTTK